jgi:hypothetical protein
VERYQVLVFGLHVCDLVDVAVVGGADVSGGHGDALHRTDQAAWGGAETNFGAFAFDDFEGAADAAMIVDGGAICGVPTTGEEFVVVAAADAVSAPSRRSRTARSARDEIESK